MLAEMIEIMRFVAAIVLGLICAWLAKRWLENFDDKLSGGLLGFAILCLIAVVLDYRGDLRRAKELQSNAESRPDPKSHEN